MDEPRKCWRNCDEGHTRSRAPERRANNEAGARGVGGARHGASTRTRACARAAAAVGCCGAAATSGAPVSHAPARTRRPFAGAQREEEGAAEQRAGGRMKREATHTGARGVSRCPCSFAAARATSARRALREVRATRGRRRPRSTRAWLVRSGKPRVADCRADQATKPPCRAKPSRRAEQPRAQRKHLTNELRPKTQSEKAALRHAQQT